MSHRRLDPRHSGPAAAFAVAAAVLICPPPAHAQGAATLFKQAQTREQAVTASDSAADLRAAARAYEALVLKYPTSSYADNALWQAAALLERAYAKSGAQTDLDKVVKLLTWLRREYSSSPLIPQVNTRLAALPAAAAKPAAEPPARTAVSPTPAAAPPPVAPPPAMTPPPAPVTPPAAAPASPAGPVVRNISQAALPRGDRITIELSQEVEVQSDRVANPDRVFFDFPNATAAAALVAHAREIRSPLVKSVRIGRPVPGVTRVVLELAGTPRHSAFPLYAPFRLVVDLESDAVDARTVPPIPVAPGPASAPAVTETRTSVPLPPAPERVEVPAPPPAPVPVKDVATEKRSARTVPPPPPPLVVSPGLPNITSSGDYSLARQLGLGVSRVVIDAGHGGHDPGAQANGINESELVLDVALRLERLLKERPGFDVVLTRRTDEFIPLEERTAIANREEADLFLSIHANASRQSTARGIESYILNFATNPAAEAVAARENATSAQTMGTLPAILKAIALNNKLAESRELATIVQTSLVRKLKVQDKGVRDLGVKQAPFVVLIGAQMPSVLAEISFLTNRSEAALLKQAAYRQQIAQALADAIVKYQTSLKKVTTVANR
jgi:N-acetylmuramoyl-L-alanine amidase